MNKFLFAVEEITGTKIENYLEHAGTDYAFRAFIPRPLVSKVITRLVDTLDADNFKNSVHDDNWDREGAYASCWNALYKAQEKVLNEEPVESWSKSYRHTSHRMRK